MSKRLPGHVRLRSEIVLRSLDLIKKNSTCPRCGGEGYVDRDDWRVTEADGRRVCFKCHGTGHSSRSYAHPVKVRYAVVKRLQPLVEAGDVEKIRNLESAALYEPYWPILEDVYARALSAAEENELARYDPCHGFSDE